MRMKTQQRLELASEAAQRQWGTRAVHDYLPTSGLVVSPLVRRRITTRNELSGSCVFAPTLAIKRCLGDTVTRLATECSFGVRY